MVNWYKPMSVFLFDSIVRISEFSSLDDVKNTGYLAGLTIVKLNSDDGQLGTKEATWIEMASFPS